MKALRQPAILLLMIFMLILAACGSTPATTAPTAAPAAEAPTAAPAAEAPTAAPAAEQPTAAEAPSPVPTATPGLSTVGTGATKIVWWHISTVKEQRDNWQNLANTFVKDHPDVSIEITVLENEAFKAMLALCGWSDQSLTTGTENLRIQATLLGATLDRNTVLSALTEQQETLHAAYDRERTLSQTIRELGCPIIPLLPGVLLVPLIGAIDSQRAQQIIGGVLEAIGEQRAQTVFLDVTGVPIVDTQVASSLIQTARAAMLLGARVVMVGIRPEIAQSIVGLGIDLSHLTMYSDLASAIRVLQLRRPLH